MKKEMKRKAQEKNHERENQKKIRKTESKQIWTETDE